ncbi:MAG TPA: oligosaccharide flippase family protein [Longimicrobiales bacterium]
MSLARDAVRGIAWSAAQSWGGQLAYLLVFIVLTRLLAPEAFGLLAMASAFIAATQLFVDQGMGDSLVQRQTLERAHLDTAFWGSLASGLLCMAGALLLAPLVAGLFDQPELTAVVRWLSLGFLIAGLTTVPSALLRRALAFRTIAIRSLVAVVLGGVAGITLAVLGFGVLSLVAQSLVTSTVGLLLYWHAAAWRPRASFSRPHFVELFSFGGMLLATYAVNLLARRGDDVVIGYFLGPVALGYYAVAYQILLALTQALTGATASVMFPVFSRLQDDRTRLRNAFFSVTRFTSTVAFPVFAGVALLAPDLLAVTAGAKWLPAAPVLRVLAFVGILHSVFYFNATLFVAVGKPAWRFHVTLANAVVSVAGFLIAVRWGITAVAIAYTAAGYLLAPLPLWLLRRRLDFRPAEYLRLYAAPALASLMMTAVVYAIAAPLREIAGAQAGLAGVIVVGAATYVLAMLLIQPEHVRQWLALARMAAPSRSSVAP